MDDVLKKPVGEWMTKKVITVNENESLKDLFKLLDKNGIVGVPVINNDHILTGIITETDLLKHYTTLETPQSVNLLGGIVYLDDISQFNEKLKEHCSEIVKDLMTTEVVTVHQKDTLATVIDKISSEGFSRLPVVDQKNQLIGIVTKSDVVHQLAQSKTI